MTINKVGKVKKIKFYVLFFYNYLPQNYIPIYFFSLKIERFFNIKRVFFFKYMRNLFIFISKYIVICIGRCFQTPTSIQGESFQVTLLIFSAPVEYTTNKYSEIFS
uniref:Uncharacterized protein n=1 Tax=Cacopsylla melanoneura TaxID=428564 RepID=A0A8D8UWV6_9HEMI